MIKFQKANIFNFVPPVPFSETRRFAWNIENSVTNTMNFQYEVGEGPLYWFRIDWRMSTCPPNSCISTTPSIINTAPNCPYEIIDNCTISPPTCYAPPDPNSCHTPMTEVWHMLATSVEHLCERINQECCHRKPPGFMHRVQQYMRPALCCDLDTHSAVDEYVDVNFLKCECGNLVDPSIADIAYPCYINRCGIHGPAYTGGPEPPISAIKFGPDVFAMSPMTTPIITPIKESPLIKNITGNFGKIPELIYCNHNLSDILKSNDFNNIKLFHQGGSWRGSKSIKNWKVSLDWTPINSGYKININIDKVAKTKLLLTVKSDVFKDGKFNVEFNYNTTSGLTSKNSVLQSILIIDDIGLFKKNDLKLNLRG